MKKMLTVILLLMMFCHFLYANTDERKSYNRLIDLAENCFISGDYNSCDSLYNNAFTLFKNPYSIDLSNAMVNASLIHNKASFFIYATMFSNYGVPSTFFSLQNKFKFWTSTKEWKSLLLHTDKHYKAFISKNASLLNLIDSMYDMTNITLNSIYKGSEMEVSDFFKIKHQVSFALDSLFRQNGYLSENIIGLNLTNDTLINSSKVIRLIQFCSFNWTQQNGILEEVKYSGFDTILMKAYNSGELDWYNFWANYSNPENYNVFFPASYLSNNQIHIPFLSFNELLKIENDRLYLGIYNIQSYLLKLKHQFKNKSDIQLNLKTLESFNEKKDIFSIVSSLN